jgi:hypothetical protein
MTENTSLRPVWANARFQDQLTSDEVWDIVHYEQSLRVKAHVSS